MSRKGNCIDNGATEQVFGHMKDEFFRGRTWPDFESFKADLDAYVAHWSTRRRRVKLKGLTPSPSPFLFDRAKPARGAALVFSLAPSPSQRRPYFAISVPRRMQSADASSSG